MVEFTGLFLGSFFDALIGLNFFFPGEPFFLAAGYQLRHGVFLGVCAVLLGGLSGDQCSFLLGRWLGFPAQRRLVAWQPKVRRPLARCRLLMKKSGSKVFLFARLLGPVAWVVPFMAGAQRVGWHRFSFFSFFGLIIGVGQFVLAGYLLACGMESIRLFD